MDVLRKLSRGIIRDWRGYLLAVALVALATWLKYLGQPNIIPSNVPILYFLAIVPTAIFFGFGPAILVCILSLLAFDYFFIAPLYQINLDIFDFPIMAIFLAVGLLFSYLAADLRRKNLIANREVEARKHSESELIKYKDHLEDLVKQRTSDLEAANKELEAFSYSVSHDLRAPLRALEGFSQALLEDNASQLDADGKDYLQRIRGASQNMSRLIDDMLKLSRLSRAEIHVEEVNLSELVTFIAGELKNSQPDRQVEITIAPDVVAEGDRSLLQILLTNLLENAWKFTGKCSQSQIEFGVSQQDGKPLYFVKDNGAGFSMAHAGKLFQPFQRLHSNRDYPGSGIGLATVQRIINRHGGRIWAEAEEDKGATFHFSLG